MFNFLKKKKDSNGIFFVVSKYIYDNFEKPIEQSRIQFSLKPRDPSEPSKEEVKLFKEENVSLMKSLLSHINEYNDSGFVDKLFFFINRSGEDDADIYRRAYIDRRLYSKIITDKNYHTSRDTIISLGAALRLTLGELNELLNAGGYALSHSSVRDLIIEFCFKRNIYDIDKINNILYHFKEKVL